MVGGTVGAHEAPGLPESQPQSGWWGLQVRSLCWATSLLLDGRESTDARHTTPRFSLSTPSARDMDFGLGLAGHSRGVLNVEILSKSGVTEAAPV